MSNSSNLRTSPLSFSQLSPEQVAAFKDLRHHPGWELFRQVVWADLVEPQVSQLLQAQELPLILRAQGAHSMASKILSLHDDVTAQAESPFGGGPVS